MNEAITPKAAQKDDLSRFATRLSSLIGGISVAKYARECGITESTVRSYVGGESGPGMFNLHRIRPLLGLLQRRAANGNDLLVRWH